MNGMIALLRDFTGLPSIFRHVGIQEVLDSEDDLSHLEFPASRTCFVGNTFLVPLISYLVYDILL